ncbi:MAG: hypothetical protein V3V04_08460 [Rhizobiaceae bacterium]
MTYAMALSRAALEHGQRYVNSFIDRKSSFLQQETISVLLRDFQNSASDWMWETDVDGKILSPSKRFCESADRSKEELGGVEFKSLVSLP